MDISFESNIREWTRGLTAFERQQLPFATAVALTDTARHDVKPAVERRIAQVFDRPTPFTKKGVGYLPARKSMLVSRVFIKDVQAAYLRLQETGGVRVPKGRAIPIPVGQRTNQYGNLPRATVQRLLVRPDTFSGRIGGQGGIWQRRKGGKLKLLIAWEPEAHYRPRFGFEMVARFTAEAHFARRFEVALDRALRTAR